MNEVLGLGVTLALGLFILLGSAIVFITKNSNKVVNFSISMALGVMIALGLFELFPEAMEHLNESTSMTWFYFLIFLLIGLGLLFALDKFVPDHDIPEPTEKEINENLRHIGIVSSIALMLHNIIEGMAVYSSVTTDLHMGLLMCIGVGLHNIPLGMVITSTFYKYNNSIKKTLFASLLISISTFIGGFIMYLLSGIVSTFILGLLLTMTLGMLCYIILFELLPHVWEHKKEGTTWFGCVLGIMILFISKLF